MAFPCNKSPIQCHGLLLAYLISVYALACSDNSLPLSSNPSQAIATIGEIDSAEDNYVGFLPPLGKDGSLSGSFDPTFLEHLIVSVCEVQGGQCVGNPVAELTSSSTGAERLRIESDVDGFYYLTIWKASARSEAVYRIRILAGNIVLNWRDVNVRSGRAVPIKFWIKKGVGGAAVLGPQGGEVRSVDNRITITIFPTALINETLITVQPSPSATPPSFLNTKETGLAYEITPHGTTFGRPVQIRMGYNDLLSSGSPDEFGIIHWTAHGTAANVVTSINEMDNHILEFELQSFSFVQLIRTDTPWQVFRHNWGIPAVKWYLEPLPVGSFLSEELVAAALKEWESVQGSLEFVRTNSPTDAQLIITETIFDREPDSPCDPIGTSYSLLENLLNLGITRACHLSGQWELTADDQLIITVFSLFHFSETSAYNTLKHEIGHAIGIAHPIASPIDRSDVPVMEEGRNLRLGLHEWDIKAAQYHYGPPVNDVPDIAGVWRFDKVSEDSCDISPEVQTMYLVLAQTGSTVQINTGEAIFTGSMNSDGVVVVPVEDNQSVVGTITITFPSSGTAELSAAIQDNDCLHTFSYNGIKTELTSPPAPAAPFDLTTSGISSGLVRLTWNFSSTDATRAVIERRESVAGPFVVIRLLTLAFFDNYAYDDFSVIGDQEYCYRVSLRNQWGTSAPSNISCALTPTPILLPAPSLLSPPNAAVDVTRTPTFSWSSIPGANQYWLIVARDASAFPTDPNATNCPECTISINTSSTSFTVLTPLAGNTVYSWKVQAWNSATGQQGEYPLHRSFLTTF